MKAGLWQILIWAGLIVFFFWPIVVKIMRTLARMRTDEERAKIRRKPTGAFKCPKCGEELAPQAKFCSKCGISVEVIDVK